MQQAVPIPLQAFVPEFPSATSRFLDMPVLFGCELRVLPFFGHGSLILHSGACCLSSIRAPSMAVSLTWQNVLPLCLRLDGPNEPC